jgi:Carboxypeptidase regulatory-like domain
MPKIICPIAFLFLLLPFCSLMAQETTAEITGLVTEGQVPLSGAIITARHLPTGAQYVSASRRDGRYNLANLKIGGPYIVTISYVGYKEEKKENIVLLVGQENKADFSLVQESKELEAIVVQNANQDKVFNNNHTGPQEIISREHFDKTPAVPRTLENFASLFPAANGFNIGGRNALFNNITLDGANFSNVFGLSTDKRAHITGQAISIEAIEQIQVNTAPYDVRMGGFAGTNINIIGRSGTNKFNGSAYSFFTGPRLTGNQVGSTELVPEQFSYNRTGFFAGGPIVKDKLFFFVNAERENLKEVATVFTSSDTDHPPGENVSFANADTLNRLRNFLVDRYGYDPGPYQGYDYITRKERFALKIDWNIDTNTTFSFKFNRFHAFKDEAVSNNGAPRGYRQPGIFGMPFSGSGYTIFNNLNNFIAELITNWGDDASNKLQAGYMALRNYRESMAGTVFPLVDIAGPGGNTYTSFGLDPFSYNNTVHIDIFQFCDIFTLYRGGHEITFGTQNFIKRYKSGFAPYYAGVYRFASLADFYSSADHDIPNAIGYNLQYSTKADQSFPVSNVGTNELSFFAQDRIRFKNRLILTYGLRTDIPVFSGLFPSNPYVASLTFRDGKQYSTEQMPGTNVLLSPRFSFNWDVTKNAKTQIRGGAGLFAGPPPLIWLNNIATNNGAQLSNLQVSENNVIAFSPDINKYIPAERVWSKSYELALVNKDFKYPHVFKANFAIDRLLPGDITASLEGAYAKDIHAVYFQNVNLPTDGTTFKGPDNRIRYSSTQINAGWPTASPENPDIDNAILMTNSNKGYAYVLTFQLQKRVSDFYLSASYSYTKTKSLNDGGALQSRMWSQRPVTGDPNSAELGNTDFYQPHRFLVFGSYRKAYAKYFATSVSFVFEAGPSGIGSYTYNGDMNNDGTISTNNDLIYIPKDKYDILLVPVTTRNGAPPDTRTADQLWAQLDNFILQDKYLNNHRGEYAGRNEVVFPFFKRLDLNITQEFILGKEKHVIKLGFDLINVGNFLNKNWGTYKEFTSGTFNTPYSASFLQYEGIDANSGRPRFSFPYLDPLNEIPLTNSFKDDTSIFSRWQGQFSIRYTFQ